MKCYTAINGEITEGIRLRRDAPTEPNGVTRYFVHVAPDHFGEVRSVDALLSSGCAHFEGDDVVVDRCLYDKGDLLPETAPDGNVLVLGSISHALADFTGDPEQPASYRTALGVNVCCHAVVSRHVNRVMGKTTGHEQYNFLAIFLEGHRIESKIFFEDEDNRALDLFAEGELLSYRDGVLAFGRVNVIRQSERFGFVRQHAA
jgi:hypothetical protein